MNEELKAVVVKIEDEKVMLSTKRLRNAPWINIHSRYSVGDQLMGKVVKITDMGAFVEIEPGLRGLIHRKLLSFGIVLNPNDFVSVGQTIEVEITEIDTDKHRLGLSRLPFLTNPWDNVLQNYYVGQVLTRQIKAIRDYGAFVELEPKLDALYHRSEMNVAKEDKLQYKYNVGDSLTLEICTIDVENRRISLKTPTTVK